MTQGKAYLTGANIHLPIYEAHYLHINGFFPMDHLSLLKFANVIAAVLWVGGGFTIILAALRPMPRLA